MNRSRLLLLIAFSICVLAVPVAALVKRAHATALPSYGAVPPFRLIDQDGKPFGLDELRGRVWVADFIFTSCSAACPRLTSEMAALDRHLVNRALAGRTRLVSISVDPERDTPERLRGYMQHVGADAQRWSFLTGPTKQIEDAVVNGFKQGLDREKDPSAQDGFTILHGTKMVLVDAQGQIRGFYDATDGESMAHLRAAIASLVDRGGA